MDSTLTDAQRRTAVLALQRADWHTEVRHQVALMELEGRSRDEIANALGLTPGTSCLPFAAGEVNKPPLQSICTEPYCSNEQRQLSAIGRRSHWAMIS
jgi:hypothetical protein